jgi:hypothetical protein
MIRAAHPGAAEREYQEQLTTSAKTTLQMEKEYGFCLVRDPEARRRSGLPPYTGPERRRSDAAPRKGRRASEDRSPLAQLIDKGWSLQQAKNYLETQERMTAAKKVREERSDATGPVFELGDHYVVPGPKGGYDVYRNEGVAAVRCAQIGAGYPGGSLQKAIDECKRREALPNKGKPEPRGRRRA